MAKNNMDILEEWVNIIYSTAKEGYNASSLSDARLCFQKIKGNCEAISVTLKCCKREERK